eukprot:TRINITY_DN5500_c0_g1_i8.p1 TRINITY_DN5500_c0_g1~~TRINITY_DN5500_c0_g1_i8.p1  ORF type:complete len:1109 (-),score=121.52 TRINITY_DN5500_c0_g1_i8:2190-5516(-)
MVGFGTSLLLFFRAMQQGLSPAGVLQRLEYLTSLYSGFQDHLAANTDEALLAAIYQQERAFQAGRPSQVLYSQMCTKTKRGDAIRGGDLHVPRGMCITTKGCFLFNPISSAQNTMQWMLMSHFLFPNVTQVVESTIDTRTFCLEVRSYRPDSSTPKLQYGLLTFESVRLKDTALGYLAYCCKQCVDLDLPLRIVDQPIRTVDMAKAALGGHIEASVRAKRPPRLRYQEDDEESVSPPHQWDRLQIASDASVRRLLRSHGDTRVLFSSLISSRDPSGREIGHVVMLGEHALYILRTHTHDLCHYVAYRNISEVVVDPSDTETLLLRDATGPHDMLFRTENRYGLNRTILEHHDASGESLVVSIREKPQPSGNFLLQCHGDAPARRAKLGSDYAAPSIDPSLPAVATPSTWQLQCVAWMLERQLSRLFHLLAPFTEEAPEVAVALVEYCSQAASCSRLVSIAVGVEARDTLAKGEASRGFTSPSLALHVLHSYAHLNANFSAVQSALEVVVRRLSEDSVLRSQTVGAVTKKEGHPTALTVHEAVEIIQEAAESLVTGICTTVQGLVRTQNVHLRHVLSSIRDAWDQLGLDPVRAVAAFLTQSVWAPSVRSPTGTTGGILFENLESILSVAYAALCDNPFEEESAALWMLNQWLQQTAPLVRATLQRLLDNCEVAHNFADFSEFTEEEVLDFALAEQEIRAINLHERDVPIIASIHSVLAAHAEDNVLQLWLSQDSTRPAFPAYGSLASFEGPTEDTVRTRDIQETNPASAHYAAGIPQPQAGLPDVAAPYRADATDTTEAVHQQLRPIYASISEIASQLTEDELGNSQRYGKYLMSRLEHATKKIRKLTRELREHRRRQMELPATDHAAFEEYLNHRLQEQQDHYEKMLGDIQEQQKELQSGRFDPAYMQALHQTIEDWRHAVWDMLHAPQPDVDGHESKIAEFLDRMRKDPDMKEEDMLRLATETVSMEADQLAQIIHRKNQQLAMMMYSVPLVSHALGGSAPPPPMPASPHTLPHVDSAPSSIFAGSETAISSGSPLLTTTRTEQIDSTPGAEQRSSEIRRRPLPDAPRPVPTLSPFQPTQPKNTARRWTPPTRAIDPWEADAGSVEA